MHERKNFPEMEEKILAFWKENNIFEKSIQQREGADDFVFYDGPPFATGLPHHGQILASTAKDLVGRYKTMRGYRVLRRWGWDCHGLPVENLIEKELEISGKKEIEEYGIDKFCGACEDSVLKYDTEWESVIDRIGRFVDFKNNYKTMDTDFMESVWWGFKQLHDKGLVYEDTRISLYCPRCETPLSNFEIAMDNSYKTVTDPSVYVKMKVVDQDFSFLIWTTTPWTLPANAAIAVHTDLEYAKVRTQEHGVLVIAQVLVETLQAELGEYEIIEVVKGSDLVGMHYEPVFTYMTSTQENTHTVVSGDFVTTGDGTGLVHIAPTFGEDDYALGKKYNLDFFEVVNSQAEYVPAVIDFAGRNVWNINGKVIELLKEKGVIVKLHNIKHEYPFCWRCDTKLVYKTQPAWFIAVSQIKDVMIKENQNINWYPEHLKEGRFGKGLESAPDWNVSRSRFWGNAIPAWKNDTTGEVVVVGSVEELEKLSGQKITDLHRPAIDTISWKGEKGGVFTRVPEVFDCWFESGSMPWASVHYPFENKEFFEKNYPAEFITEYIAQTRGWFYTMHVLAVGIFGKPSFTNAVTTGTILAENGQKMSKSKKNFTPPQELIDQYGVDSMRYYLMASPLMKGENLRYADKDQAEAFRKVIMLPWNVYTFFEIYKNDLKSLEYQGSDNILDTWVVSHLHQLITDMTQLLDVYDITTATRRIGDFINELSTWYIRRSRDRFKGDDPKDQQQALQTTRYVLLELSKLMAPITPFLAEDIYQHVGGEKESVHLEDWPEYNASYVDEKVIHDMDLTRGLIERLLALRAEGKIKVRQALSKAWVNKVNLPDEYIDIISEEVNVKEIESTLNFPQTSKTILKNDQDQLNVALDIEITPELQMEGYMRELTRYINSYRKELLLTPQDQVTLYYETSEQELQQLFTDFAGEVQSNVKAQTLINEKKDIETGRELDINGLIVWVGIEK
jgi:isoleucyl-tRNA synthetase